MNTDRPPSAPPTEAARPSLALIVAAYNAEGTLPRALDSVLRQGYEDWQVVVVDDGSIDATLDIARAYESKDSRIRVLAQTNRGTAAARNAALPHVRAEFVGYLDADDLLADGYMCTMLRLMQDSPGRDIYSSDGLFVYANGSTKRVLGYQGTVSVTLDDMIRECRILGGGALVRTEALRSLGGYRDMYGEDYDLWLRAIAGGLTHVGSPEALYLYHQGVEGQKSERRQHACASTIRALTDLIKSGLLTEEQEREARVFITRNEANLELELSAQRLRHRVERLVGERWVRPVMAGIHSVSWILRPLRRWLAGRAHRI